MDEDTLGRDDTEPDSKKLRLSDAVDMWESQMFGQLFDSFDPDVHDDVEEEKETLPSRAQKFHDKFEEVINEWIDAPDNDCYKALKTVALYVDSNINWDAQSDIVVTRVLGTLFLKHLFAHSDGIHYYINGARRQIEQLPPSVLIELEESLMRAQVYFQNLQHHQVPRDWEAVMTHLEYTHKVISFDPILDKDIDKDTWAGVAASIMPRLSCRFTNTGRANNVMESFGEWFQTPRGPPTPIINFPNAQLQLETDEKGSNKWIQIDKHPDRACYFHIDVHLGRNCKPTRYT